MKNEKDIVNLKSQDGGLSYFDIIKNDAEYWEDKMAEDYDRYIDNETL